MIFYFVIAAVFLILGMVAVNLSLLELDKRVTQLGQSMEGRYGKWLERAATEGKKAASVKAKPEAPKTGIVIPPLKA